ncbi:fluoride efflux transporter FluC [Gracilibacillus timonensis]|uniref:fluoride efflux transporter FluC n=1 Tax=Gracilibacillus timonensis TaxID=1816696 RepID=UPI000825A08B|nr:CrcB family protein [Gracilibacillus timonensis]
MVLNVMLVAIGGAFGALARALMTTWLKRKASSSFPTPTFLINMLGSFLLGILTSLSLGSAMALLLGMGFMGSFTTFSTFNVENMELLREEKYKVFFSYIGASYLVGIVALFAGLAIGIVLK